MSMLRILIKNFKMDKNLIFARCVLIALFLIFVLLIFQQKPAQAQFPDSIKTMPFMNPDLVIAERVKDLVSRMTLEEKISLLAETAPAIPRLGIIRYNHGNEALHGVVRPGKATVFPQAIAFAATWNPDLIYQVATAISDEARAKSNQTKDIMDPYSLRGRASGLLTFWSPTINMARDPRWGRTPETYGEDPFLASRIAVAFVTGLQGDHPRYLKVVATPKHFAANNEEHNRFECNARISERALREYYLQAFKSCIVEGKAQAIMSAYNAINGVPCTANKWLLTDVLRNDWNFQGYVVTDCGAISHLFDRHHYAKLLEEAAALAINAGVDLECGSWCNYPYVFLNYLEKAYHHNLVTMETIDRAIARVLTARFRLGMFDPPEMVPYKQIPFDVVGSKKHVLLALQTSRESIVLLKNEKLKNRKLLPIDKNRTKSIAVMGPNAAICQFGDYSGEPMNESVTPLEGIRRKVGDQIHIKYIPWRLSSRRKTLALIKSEYLRHNSEANEQRGLKGEYFPNTFLRGEPTGVRIDQEIDFEWLNQPPDPLIATDTFSVRWTGKLVPPITGNYTISVKSNANARLYIDSELLIDHWQVRISEVVKKFVRSESEVSYWTPPIEKKAYHTNIMLKANQKYDIRLEYAHLGGEPYVQLEWIIPDVEAEDRFAAEKKLAAECDLVIAFLGLGKDDEWEGKDRIDLKLPADQHEFIQEIFKVNRRTIVVLINGSPLAINWIDENIPAIIEAWYPGEQGGNAIADVLFGDYNPAGRLPLTFYKSTDQLLPFDDYEISKGRTYMYLQDELLYPFGYGQSYTSFAYSGLSIEPDEATEADTIMINFNVKNIGNFDGDEVVQLYVHDIESSVYQPIKQLKGFKRIHLKNGEQKTITLPLKITDLSYYEVNSNTFVVEPGLFEIMVGSSSRDIKLRELIIVR